MKKTVTWLVLADGQRARGYLYRGADLPPEPVVDFEMEHAGDPSREIGSDKPGRMQPSFGVGGTSFSPRNDLHEQAEERFLDDVARKMADVVAAGRCDQLILAAAPRALGYLRQKLAPGVSRVLKAEIPKDLTKTDLQKLAPLVAQQIGF
ncbi:MAG: host attachment protein [Rhodospirillaceae bacterium]|nr:host attachment protein [Rhodospirillaceae bacterium]